MLSGPEIHECGGILNDFQLSRAGWLQRWDLPVSMKTHFIPMRNKPVRNYCMKIQIDLKSALFGMGAALLIVLATGAATSSPTVGRYQIAAAGTPSVFVVVDTATGKVWMGNGTANQLRSDSDFFDAKLDK
jgi:hypothetical protein